MQIIRSQDSGRLKEKNLLALFLKNVQFIVIVTNAQVDLVNFDSTNKLHNMNLISENLNSYSLRALTKKLEK